MRVRPRQFAFTILPPIFSIALLAGMASERATHLKPQDVEPYHARAKAGVDAVPYLIDGGRWTGTDEEIPVAAQKLLRPNAILSRLYVDNSPADYRSNEHRFASLLIVQCRD